MNRVWIELPIGSLQRLERMLARTAAQLGPDVRGRVLQTYYVADGDKSRTTRMFGGHTDRALLAFVWPDGTERQCRAWSFCNEWVGPDGQVQASRWQLADNAWWMLADPKTRKETRRARYYRRHQRARAKAGFTPNDGARYDGPTEGVAP